MLAENPRELFYHKGKGLEPWLWDLDGDPKRLYDDDLGCKTGSDFYCTAIIQHNDWQIPKDYPRELRY